ncbi:MAG: addiction module toxin, HicA family [Calditrichaeota bacterium]|nr:addiction module toxin, HicA family [Calditrichota bacterium]
MAFPKHIWDQLKNITSKELIKALEKDGWQRDVKRGAIQVYFKPNGKRVTIHHHPKKTYGPKTLQSLFKDIGWKEEDLRRLKLIK